ncbi:MAG: phospho-N-acetylmuramoyl-pentapeptide-transferase [Micrococcales bacterium]|nr:phospho-N-acetylmuramoyl-pentapeptide-transferase [Micrococcales bacterium]
MVNIIVAGALGLAIALFGTPVLIKFLIKKQYGQFIRQDGPAGHHTKRGTPTMGGIVMIIAATVGYLGSDLLVGHGPSASGLLVLYLMVGMGLIGFLDDFTKIRRERSLGLRPTWKFIGQGVIGVSFAVLAIKLPDSRGWTPGSKGISFLRDTSVTLAAWGPIIGLVAFVIWANFLITAWTNAVNLTDGLDGLAAGICTMIFGAYIVISFWAWRHACPTAGGVGEYCYTVRDPLDAAVITAALAGACLGFLWWNASPARIFMGDTGSLALGGAYAGMSIITRTEILAALIGGLLVLVVLSDIIQIGSFKLTGRRVFKMAPLHHHFELSGWGEVTIVIRFWLISVLFVASGVALFYSRWLVGSGG